MPKRLKAFTVFDTAPAYGASETILGRFIAALPPEQRSSLRIMTKAGEHWNADSGRPFVDQGIDALKRSIDRSISLLGEIDVLQIHKASEEVVASPAVVEAIDYAKAGGIRRFGASVSSTKAAELAIASGIYTFLQFPLNMADRKFLPLLTSITQAGMHPIINRPFAMGELVATPQPDQTGRAPFRFIHRAVKAGIVLTGTSKPQHLRQNFAAFGDPNSD
jgi:aryl-alcohol dehydrogenase-like predicted oxidoreductase